jgi:heterodisulfide reductase subunit D
MTRKARAALNGFTGEFFEELVADSEVGEKVRSCLQCGTCSASCPVARYADMGPREIVRLTLTGQAEEVLRPEVLYYCSACYSCSVRCPMGIKLTELVNLLRDVMVSRGDGPLPSQLELVKSVENYDNPWQMPRAQRDRWARKVQPRLKVLPKQAAEALYYPGCTAAYLPNMQKVAAATARVLAAAGVDFGIMGREEICCGSTAMRVGVRGTFTSQAERNIEKLNALGVERIITACAGCYGIMKHEYPRVGPFRPEVLHVSEVLAGLIDEGRLELGPVERTITYHDPCHLARHGGVTSAPRRVLDAIPGLELVEMSRIGTNARCCGGGGGLRTGHTDRAVEVASDRQGEAMETGAGELVTCCPFCEMNLSDALAAGGGLPVVDLVEVVLESISGDAAVPEEDEPAAPSDD